MTFLVQTLPVALAVALAVSLALVFSKSLLSMMFEGLRRLVENRQVDTPSEVVPE